MIQSPDYQLNKISQIVNMSLHIGKEIRKKAKELKISVTELSERIHSSRQNVYDIFDRSSIDTDLLYRISEALNFDFFSYYRVSKESLQYKEYQSKIEKLEEEKEVYFHTVQNNLEYIKSLKNNLEKLKEEKDN